MSQRRWFVLLTAGHFVLTFATLLGSLAIVMAAFDGEGSGVGGAMLLAVHRVLSFPLGSLGGNWLASIQRGGFPLEQVFYLANSMLWAAVGVWSWRRVRRRADAHTIRGERAA